MKAVRIYQHGGPEALTYEDVPEPKPRANEILLRVRACAMNHLDLWVRRGVPGVSFGLPRIPGSDIAGEVVEVGELCERIRPGQRVLLAPGLSCRQCLACLECRDNECRRYALFGAGLDGGDCEYVPAPEYAAIPIPDDLSFEDAAAAPVVFLTAWHMLFTRARLSPGEEVLVLSASSGVGMAALQLARLFHCRVIATAGGDDKMARARRLGADEVIDHYRQDITAEVKRLTGKRGVDVVFEHVGEATWPHSIASLAPNGRLVTCGATTGCQGALDIRHLFAKQQAVLGSFMGTLGELHRVLQFVFRKQVRPVIDSLFPMTDVAEAHRRLESRLHFGKIVLTW